MKYKSKAFFFGNMYLSPIQHGIQALHVTTKLSMIYQDNPLYVQWASKDYIVDLRNGGYQSNLEEITALLSACHRYCPQHIIWTEFKEEVQALNGALTSVGCIISEELLNYPKPSRILDDRNQNITVRDITRVLISSVNVKDDVWTKMVVSECINQLIRIHRHA